METDNEVISIKGLYKSFGALEALRGIDFTLRKGENVAVLSRSGSGKSVLIKIIIGLLKPDQGEVIVLGEHMKNKKLSVSKWDHPVTYILIVWCEMYIPAISLVLSNNVQLANVS